MGRCFLYQDDRRLEQTLLRIEHAMKLLTCIVFHYKKERLCYLQKIVNMQQHLAEVVNVVVNTNTSDANELESIRLIAPVSSARFTFEIESFDLPNPWLLPWAHKVTFARKMSDPSFTHFMFTEDDIEVAPVNVQYWLNARDLLRPLNLYPSFFRVEWSEEKKCWTSTDIAEPVSVSKSPRVRSNSSDYQFINLPNPYQAMFFYDRELMEEHAASETFDITRYGRIEMIDHNKNWGGGGVAERANYALTFVNVPPGFTSRNIIPFFEKYMLIDPRCFVHHLPNNYANNMPDIEFGKLGVNDVLHP